MIQLQINLKKKTFFYDLQLTRGDQKDHGKVISNRIAFMDCNKNSQT